MARRRHDGTDDGSPTMIIAWRHNLSCAFHYPEPGILFGAAGLS